MLTGQTLYFFPKPDLIKLELKRSVLVGDLRVVFPLIVWEGAVVFVYYGGLMWIAN